MNREDAKDAKIFLVEDPELDRLAFAVIGAAIEVQLGLLINFNVPRLKGSIRRVVRTRRSVVRTQ